MAQQSWPFHNGTSGTPVLEDQWSIMARLWAASGVMGAPGDANLQVYANSSGRQVYVRTGRAAVRGHYYSSGAEEALTLAANGSGNPRIDRVVLRLDPAANSVLLAVKQGTPAGSPSAPALTQTDTGVWELPLARVTVANGAATISAGNVTDERVFTAPPPILTTSGNRPASPLAQQVILEADTGAWKMWDGAAWIDVADSTARAAANAAQTAANNAQIAANNANGNANGRVSKSGDTINGSMTVTGAIYTDNVLHVRGAELVNNQKFYTNRDAMPAAAGTGGFNIIDHHFLVVPKSGGSVQQVQKYDGTVIRDLMITYSTKQAKKNVKRAVDVPDVTALQPSTFRWKVDAIVPFADERDRDQLGLIAEDVAEVDPRLVIFDEGQPRALNTGALIAALIHKVTELQDRIDALEAS